MNTSNTIDNAPVGQRPIVAHGDSASDGGLWQGKPAESRAHVRLGAISAILGALLALVVNLRYPIRPDDPEALLTLIAEHANWGLLNLGLMVSTLFILGGLHSLSQVARGPSARGLSHLGVVVALPGAGSMLAGVAVEGYALKALADFWASASGVDKADAFRAALAVEQVQQALFYTWAAFFVGAPFLLLGLSGLMTGGGFPRWLGALGTVGGAGAFAAGAAGLLGAPLPSLVFVVAATLVTLWLLIAGTVVLHEIGGPVFAA